MRRSSGRCRRRLASGCQFILRYQRGQAALTSICNHFSLDRSLYSFINTACDILGPGYGNGGPRFKAEARVEVERGILQSSVMPWRNDRLRSCNRTMTKIMVKLVKNQVHRYLRSEAAGRNLEPMAFWCFFGRLRSQAVSCVQDPSIPYSSQMLLRQTVVE